MVSRWNVRSLRAGLLGALPVLGLAFAVACSGSSSSSTPATPAPTVPAPVITTQPLSHTATDGHFVSLSVVATGTDLTYTWRKNASPISGLSSASFYTFKAALADDGAHYSVVVTNPGGSVISQDAVLTVGAAAQELIQNGSFEFLGSNGNASTWVFSDTQMTIKYATFQMTPPLNAGTYFLANSYWSAVKNDQAYQTVTIPANATQANLVFKNAIANVDFTSTPGAAVNTWTVKIQDNAGADLATLLSQTDLDSNVASGQPVWTSRSYDLLAYKGQTIRIAFGSSQTDAAKNTLFGTDLVSLNVK